ncbi:MaoC family dehydratase [Geodermatophilus sp. SYSU D01186]
MTQDARDGFGLATIGDHVTFSKTVGESDVYLFAGITGDLNANHVNEQVMAQTKYGRRIAHGVLTVGFMSTASTLMIDKLGGLAVSYGYDRVRFVKPLFIGDTVTVRYEIAERLDDQRRTVSAVEATNQDGETVAVARHILHFL